MQINAELHVFFEGPKLNVKRFVDSHKVYVEASKKSVHHSFIAFHPMHAGTSAYSSMTN